MIGCSMACESPLKLEKFQFLVNEAKLQAPTSGNSYKLTGNFCNEYFYLSDGKYMTFEVSEEKNEHKRSELRFLKEWNVDTENKKFIEERIKLEEFNKEEFTFLQIHDGIKPLIRIVWYKDFKGMQHHLWAFVRLNEFDGNKREVRVFDLGLCPEDFFNVKLSVENAILSVYINGYEKFEYDVSYWKNKSYFKTGVYLQNTGRAKIYIDKIKIGY
jgi:hypothetical protein